MTIERPSPTLLDHIYQSGRREYFFRNESAVAKLFRTFPENKKFDHVLLKVTALSELGNSPLWSHFDVAKIIWLLDIDPLLNENSLGVIELITTEYAKLYSFATKYCNWHKSDIYPIYDAYVWNMLNIYKKQHQFSSFHQKDLRDYQTLARVLIEFKSFYNLDMAPWGPDPKTFKQIDRFLRIASMTYCESHDEPGEYLPVILPVQMRDLEQADV